MFIRYDEAIKISPSSHSMFTSKGFALMSLGKFEEAVEAFIFFKKKF